MGGVIIALSEQKISIAALAFLQNPKFFLWFIVSLVYKNLSSIGINFMKSIVFLWVKLVRPTQNLQIIPV